MQVMVIRSELAKILGFTSKFVSSRTQLPILENVVLGTSKTRMYIKATNLEISMYASVGAKVAKEGEVAVPGRTLSEIIGSLGTETVEIAAEKEQVKIVADGFKGRLMGMNTNDFPSIPEAMGKGALKLNKEIILESLSKVFFCVSRDDTRPVLTGVLLIIDSDKKKIVMVASDGFRLSQKTVKSGLDAEGQRVIVPRGILAELPRVLVGEDKEMLFEIKKTDNQVVVGYEGMAMGSRVIEGEFPNFEKIMPKAPRVKVGVNKEELAQAVRLAEVFARDSANVVTMKVNEEALTVSAKSTRSGEQEMKVAARVEGEKMEIAFNCRFVQEFLGVVEGEEVEIELTDGTSPGIFRDSGDKDFLHLIMPVRVQG